MAKGTRAARAAATPRARLRDLPRGIHRVTDANGKPVTVQAEDGRTLHKWKVRIYDRRTRTQPQFIVIGTLADAEHFAAEKRRLRDHTRLPLTAGRIKAIDYLETHLEEYAFLAGGEQLRPLSSWSKHRAMLEGYLLPALGENAYMQDITTKMLKDAIAGLRKLPTKEQAAAGEPGGPVSAWTKATVAGSAKTFFRDAKRAGVILTNPASDLPVGWGQRSERRATLVPSITEVELLAAAMDEVWPEVLGGEIVRLFAYAGPRMEELVALYADRVYPRQRRARISRIATESGGRRQWRSATEEAEDIAAGGDIGLKTVNAARDIIFIDRALESARKLEMRRRTKLAEEGERELRRTKRREAAEARGRSRTTTYVPPVEDRWKLLVTNSLGGPLSYSTWRRKLEQAHRLLASRGTPVSYTAHELRHVCASLLIASGATAGQVCNQMGHATEAFTKKVYGHLWPTDLTDLAERVSAKVERLTESESNAIRLSAGERDDDPWG